MASDHLQWIKDTVYYLKHPVDPGDDDETYETIVGAKKDFNGLSSKQKEDIFLFLLGQVVL